MLWPSVPWLAFMPQPWTWGGGVIVGGTLLRSIAKLGFKFVLVKNDGKEATHGNDM